MTPRDTSYFALGAMIGLVAGLALSLTLRMAVDMAAGPGPERFGWPSDYEQRRF